jgi:transcription initiation factor TFIIIB Brf1 subunit/transcription initiation factor TFIIB
MAQSLVCKDCSTFLRSVKEAQDHADATGHTNFEESVEAVKRLVCTDCGKVCKTKTEQDLHTKRTGHAQFQDKTGEAPSINTEVEMAEARADLNDGGAATADRGGTSVATEAELVAAEVNESLLQQMLDMGFANNRALRAIYSSGGESIDAAIAWVADHENDVDIDEPLMVPKATAKKKLSPEEAKSQALELIRKAKEKREAEERETERLREVERVRVF